MQCCFKVVYTSHTAVAIRYNNIVVFRWLVSGILLSTGAGINVFHSDKGGPKHALTNNSFLIARSNGIRFRFVCRSNATGTNIGYFIGLGGNGFNGNEFFEVRNNSPAEIFVSNSAEAQLAITDRQQGIYSCRIPDDNGMEIEIGIGIYPSGFNSKYNLMHSEYFRVKLVCRCFSILLYKLVPLT